jgi:hypothetical protein
MHPTRLDRHEATCGNATMSGYGRTVGENVGENVTTLNAVVADPHNNNCERACIWGAEGLERSGRYLDQCRGQILKPLGLRL